MLEGMDKKNSYDLFWLSEDIETMSLLFEYSDRYARDLLGFQGTFDRFLFANDLMRSNLRFVMETGHPGLLSEAAEDVFERYYEVDCHKSFDRYRTTRTLPDLARYHMYWVGGAYAYIHYHEDMLSSELIEKIPLEDMIDFYTTGHQLTYEGFYERLKEGGKYL